MYKNIEQKIKISIEELSQVILKINLNTNIYKILFMRVETVHA